MSALGHKQSFVSLASDRLVPARSGHSLVVDLGPSQLAERRKPHRVALELNLFRKRVIVLRHSGDVIPVGSL